MWNPETNIRGPVGPVGPVGPPGPTGVSTSRFFYRKDNGTTASDPGEGRYRYNNSIQGPACTALYFSNVTQDNFDVTALFVLSENDDDILLQDKNLASDYQHWRITGDVISHGTWFEVPVAYVDGTGVVFIGNHDVAVLVRSVGVSGPEGPIGPEGPEGPEGPQGDVGPPGPQGVKGDVGPIGPQGVKGDTGPLGPVGPEGPLGPIGPQGVKGDTGPVGPQGPEGDASTVPGPPGLSGAIVSDTPPSVLTLGSFWYESDTGLLYIRYQDPDGTSTPWVAVSGATSGGPMGLQGPAGPQGAASTVPGPQGPPGELSQATADARYLQLTGGTLTGGLAVQGISFPSSGAGFEFVYSGGVSQLQSYDRNAGQWKPLTIRALDVSFTCNVTPSANGAQNLGSAALRWGTIYTSDLSLSNGVGDWTIVEGEDDLFLYNNKRGKTYKFALTEVDPSVVPAKKV